MDMHDSIRLAERIMAEAGWTPARSAVTQDGQTIPNADGRFVMRNMVLGHPPPGAPAAFACKELTKVPQAMAAEMGLDPADYPDEPHEAAAWLVARFAVPVADLSTEATLAPVALADAPPALEADMAQPININVAPVFNVTGGNASNVSDAERQAIAETQALFDAPGDVPHETIEQPVSPEYDAPHETHGETGETEGALSGDAHSAEGADYQPGGGGAPLSDGELADKPIDADFPDTIFDADFTDPQEPEVLDLGAELLDTDYMRDPSLLPEPEGEAAATEGPGGQFIFGDNLDQKRTAAIGLVMRHARSLMPFWTTDSDTALIELRNFTMGVAEGRWPDDEGRRNELDALEATLSRIGSITQARDAKVEFLESATREQIEAFQPESDWP